MKASATCGEQPPRGVGPLARKHAPPAPDQAQGDPQPRPASPIGRHALTSRGPSQPAIPTQAALIKKAKFTGGKLGMLS